MAYTQQVDRSTGTAMDTPEIASERAIATARQSAAVRSTDVERINYMNHIVEVPKIDHQALGRPVDKQYERNEASVMQRLRTIGVSVATVVNFLPFQLRSDAVLFPLRAATIRAPKDGEPYVTYTFPEAWIEPTRMGADSPKIAFEFHPIQLAQEFSKINAKGVFAFIGLPADLTDERWLKTKSTEEQHHGLTYGEAFKRCQAEAVEWMQEMFRRGRENERMKIGATEPQKAAAKRLYHLGFNKELPEWVERQRDVSVKITMCPRCQRPAEPGAASCTGNNCGYILDPRKAYEINAISEEDPSLERLTRAEVKEMGISDYVAETSEEKRARLEVGGTKPQSKVAMRMIQQQDEVADRNAAKIGEATAEALKAGAVKKKETEAKPKE